VFSFQVTLDLEGNEKLRPPLDEMNSRLVATCKEIAHLLKINELSPIDWHSLANTIPAIQMNIARNRLSRRAGQRTRPDVSEKGHGYGMRERKSKRSRNEGTG